MISIFTEIMTSTSTGIMVLDSCKKKFASGAITVVAMMIFGYWYCQEDTAEEQKSISTIQDIMKNIFQAFF